jgi:small subunit ribosomal protein S20
VANTAQARKRVRQSEKRRIHNSSLRSSMRTAAKKVLKTLSSGDAAQAAAAYRAAVPEIDRLARKGIIHRNKAARLKSRLNRQLKNAWPTA